MSNSVVRNGPSRISRTRSTTAALGLEEIKFVGEASRRSWYFVEKRFNELTATADGLLPRSSFGECIGMRESKEFACELFDALARSRNITCGSITKEELREFWEQISDPSFDSRLRTFFDMIDKDGDGRITEDEVREMIILSASANQLSNIVIQADEYAKLFMTKLDHNKLGYLTIESLEMLILQGPNRSLAGDNEGRGLSRMLSQKLKPTHANLVQRKYRDFCYFVVDNWQRVLVMALWIGIMAGLFTYKYIEYKNRAVFEVLGHCVCMAKGAAETLKLNMALILLPVCRNTITWLRNKTKLAMAVPFDDNLNFHKLIAVAIALGVGIHGISHLACDFPRLLNASSDKYNPLGTFFGEEQPTSYWHFVKGWEVTTGILMVVLMAIAFTLASSRFRRSRVRLPKPLNKFTGFNAFWYSHHLFIIVYGLLIIHGIKLYMTHEWYKKTTWMYLTVPVTLYLAERLIRVFRSSINSVKILKVAVYPGNVIALHMSKPQGLKYKSGQYIFINCAAVSPFEWHPFYMTSAPMDDHLSIHMRTLGDWSRQLKLVFSEACQPPRSFRSDYLQGNNYPNFPRVLIDGPYAAPSQDYRNYGVVLLLGLGIGLTPMISIIKDIVNNIMSMEEEEEANSLEEGTATPLKSRSESGAHSFKTRKAYFYWVTREQGSFDWFKGVLDEVAELDTRGIVEMHNYCTSVYEEGDARSVIITMLQSLNHAKNGLDVVSGTRITSHFGKPNHRNTFKGIALNHPNTRVGVFYCGAPALEQELRELASDFSHKTTTKFEFHKENM
ncbi:hypothetical protein ABFS83_09G078900 [Erythranthe nasuta]